MVAQHKFSGLDHSVKYRGIMEETVELEDDVAHAVLVVVPDKAGD
jgi:hypothetical protein